MKILIIGFGSIGKRHYNILNQMTYNSEIIVVSRQDLDGINSVETLEEVNNIENFDYFVIASITSKHFDDLRYINENVSNKTILVEKPLFHKNLNIQNNQNKIFVGYNLRFHPLIIKVKNEIKNKQIISARFYAGQYLPTWRPQTDYRNSYSAKKEEGGGILLDYSHDIDLIHYLLGDIYKFESYNNKISNLDISSDDYLSMIGITNNNVHFTLLLDSISKIQKREIQINLEDETIEVDLINNIFTSKKNNENIKIFEMKEYHRNVSFENMHKLILDSNVSQVTTFEDGVKLNKVFEEIRTNSNLKDW